MLDPTDKSLHQLEVVIRALDSRKKPPEDVRSLIDSDELLRRRVKENTGLCLTKCMPGDDSLPGEAAQGSNLAEVHPLCAVHERRVRSREKEGRKRNQEYIVVERILGPVVLGRKMRMGGAKRRGTDA